VRFVAVTLLLASGIGGLAAYVVHRSGTGPWTRELGYFMGLSLVAGAVLASCSAGA
jgi:hypothetical protein